MITYTADSVEMPTFDKRKVSAWIRAVAQGYGFQTGNITYIFTNDARELAVNQEFLQHDYFTDIITFDYGTAHTISGDIFISLDMVRHNAEQVGTPFSNELLRIIIHGILHLTGQADKTPETRAEMTRKENLALEKWYQSIGTPHV